MFDYAMYWLVLGIALVSITLADALWTTLTVSGAGYLSSTVARVVGGLAMRGPKTLAENSPIVALFSSFVLWSLLLWLGWTLVFSGAERAVVDSSTLVPATLTGRLYFSGFTLTTLGIGDLKPEGAAWQIATVLSATSGFLILTLFVTYALSVITALNDRRALGAGIGHLGSSAEEIALLMAHDEQQLLATRLFTFTGQLEQAAMQSDAYPVLDYSYVRDPDRSFDRGLVSLGELSLLLEHALAPENTLPAVAWKPLRQAIDLMISEKHHSSPNERVEELPSLNLADLAAGGIILRSDADKRLATSAVIEERRRWHAWLQWHRRHSMQEAR